MVKTLFRNLAFAVLLVLFLAQFFGPEKNAGDIRSIDPFITETNPPESIQIIMKNACFDCHSNHTRYPWYNTITPVNYWLADHIRHGKSEFNASEWSSYSEKRKVHKLKELAEEVENRHMPLSSYTWIHDDAVLSDRDIEALISWVESARMRYTGLNDKE